MSEWWRKRQLKKKVDTLREQERHLFRVKTRHASKAAQKRREIFQQYLNQGKIPPRRLVRSYRVAQRMERIATEMYSRVKEAREHFKEQLRDLERGIDTTLTLPEEVRAALEEFDEASVTELERLADLVEQEQFDLSLLKQRETELDIRESELDMLLQDDTQAVMGEWEEQFLAELASEFPEEFEQIPEELKEKAEKAKEKLQEGEGKDE